MTTAIETFTYEVADSGCWIWQGYTDVNGYGRIYNRSSRQTEWVHRYSYEMHKGPIAPRHEIDHTCQTTNCVNPQHLDQVTRPEHVRRTWQRLGKDDLHATAAAMRRQGYTYREVSEAPGYAGKDSARLAVMSAIAKGLVDPDEIPRVKHLSDVEREDIRLLYAFGFNQPLIAEMYGIDNSHVSRIINKKSSRGGVWA